MSTIYWIMFISINSMINLLASPYRLFLFVYWLLKSADLPPILHLEKQGWETEKAIGSGFPQ